MFVCPECGRAYPAPGFCTEDGAAAVDGSSDPMLGQTVGSYRIAKLLGKGGMGTVYRAVHPGIGSRVAIKFLSPECAQSPSLVERFFAEARAVNLIRHDSIVSVTDLASTADQRPYIVMEHLEGVPLAHYMGEGRALPLGTLLRLVGEVLEALGAAHAKGIVHRDLKPDNIFVTTSGRPKVLDFGIAKLRPELGGLSDATRTGSLLGTPQYMSPEQAAGAHVDHRADLYSVGVILFEGVTGQRPFPAQTLYELLKAHVELMPPAPSLLRPDIPPALEEVLLHALQKDPAYRYQSSQDFRAALDHAARFLPQDAFAPLGSPVPSAWSTSSPHALPTPGFVTPAPLPMTLAPATPVFVAAPPAPARKSNVWWIVFGTIGVVLALTLATCGACVCAAGAGSGGTTQVQLDGQTLSYQPAQFNPAELAPTALLAAKRRAPGSSLVSVTANGYFTSQALDLTRDGNGSCSYSFSDGPRCFSLVVTSTTATWRDQPSCIGIPVRNPRCNPDQIWTAVSARNGPGGNTRATMVYSYAVDGQPTWHIEGPGFSQVLVDDCGAEPRP